MQLLRIFRSNFQLATSLVGLVAGLTAFHIPDSARADDGASTGGGRIIVEGLVLWRDKIDGGPLTGNDGGPGLNIDADDLDPSDGLGLRIFGEASSNRLSFLPAGWSWQVGGMFVSGIKGDLRGFDPNEDTTATYAEDLGGVVSPQLSDGNSDEIGSITLDHSTTLAGTESNWLTPNGSVLGGRAFIGSRFIHFREELEATLFDDFPASDNNHNIFIRTRNNMYGVQIGWEGYVPVGSSISIGGRFAGGLFANSVERHRAFRDQDTPENAFQDDLEETEFSQMLEANPKINFDLGGGVSLFVGGTVIWLNDVSQAASHWSSMLNLVDNNIRADEDVLLYGVSAGMIFKFD